MEWYALYVETGQEEYVQKGLRMFFDDADLHSMVPKRKLPEKQEGKHVPVLKVMFPGYVFIQTKMNVDRYYQLKNVPRIFRLLKHSDSYYSKIPAQEMSLITKLVGHDDIVDYSSVLVENSNVQVKSGPLVGMEGIIKKIDKRKRRAKIAVNLMGEEKVMDVGIEVLKQAD